MGRKAAETTLNINSALRPGSANKRTVQWRFKKFCKGDETALKVSVVAGRRKLAIDNDERNER